MPSAPQEMATNESKEMPVDTCRMYEEKFPEKDDVVMVTIRRVSEDGVFVSLNEYNNIEGMILLSELSKRRIRSVKSVARIGKTLPCVVIRLDEQKGYIDLSKRRVTHQDVEDMDEKYAKSKLVHSIIRQLSNRTQISMIKIYEKWVWDLYKRFGHAYYAFSRIVTELNTNKTTNILEDYNINQQVLDAFFKIVKIRLSKQPMKIRADIEITCFGPDGIDGIKKGLREGLEKHGKSELPIKIQLVSSPWYAISTTTSDTKHGIETLSACVSTIFETMRNIDGGGVTIKHAARALQL
ncbi:hypothetical protein AAMO2058_001100000 [Amorphochlora amoebiformis]